MQTENTMKMTPKQIRASLRKEAQAINERNRVPGDPHYKEPRSQKVVTVCDKCLTESCWQGHLMCAEAQTAGTITATEAEIAQLIPSVTELAAAWSMTFADLRPTMHNGGRGLSGRGRQSSGGA